MKLISFKPSFFASSKKSKKTRSPSDSFSSSSSSSTSASIRTPKSVLPAPAKISPRDLEALLRRLAPGPAAEEAELLAMLAEASGGFGSGSEIDLAALGGGAAAAELRETFAVFDVDGDGRISAEELMGMFAMLGDDECTMEDCRRMIGGVDSDSDGFVGFEDFARMMDGQI